MGHFFDLSLFMGSVELIVELINGLIKPCSTTKPVYAVRSRLPKILWEEKMKRAWIEDRDGLLGLEYAKFIGVPMRRSRTGPAIDLKPLVIERLAAKAILSGRAPIRGKELKVLRAALGISLEKFARRLGLSSGAIFLWEKSPKNRLLPVNEVAVRVLCAEELGVDLPGRLSQLLGVGPNPITVVVTQTRRKRLGPSEETVEAEDA